MDPISNTVDPKQVAPPKFASGLLVSVLAGTMFGFAMQKGHVIEPDHILGQMKMQKFFMIKMFLSAAAFSMFSTGLFYLFPSGRVRIMNARKWVFNGYRGVPAAVVGGLIIGVGLALSGACPGSTPIQFGAGVQWAGITLIGAFLGAMFFGFVEPRFLKPTGFLNSCCMAGRGPSLDTYFGIHFTKLTWSIGLALVAVAGLFEHLFPWRTELANEGMIVPADSSVISPVAVAWPPMMAGLVIGLLQIPLLWFAGETLGASRSYVTVWANAAHAIAPAAVDKNTYLSGARTGLGNWSQTLFVAFSVLGSFLAASLGSGYGTALGFSQMRSLIGGFLLVFGARFAGGCTSGNGLSGNALLANISPFATASMLAGGMITALFF